MYRMLLSLLLFTLFIPIHLKAQQTISDTFTIDNLERNMIIYVPASYNPNTPVPLVFNFHGYTSNALQQMWYGDFRAIADTANFIIVHPNGTLDNTNTTHWNVGFGGSTVDDVGFIDQLIDSLLLEYTIDTQRIYATGMSNGGYFSYQLACQLSDRIAAIASVTGSMTPISLQNCSCTHPMPVMQIHGTADSVVYYAGASWTLGVEQLVDDWVAFNQCDTTPQVQNIPNTSITDGCTATSYRYTNGNNGAEVVFYRIQDGGHTWPGAPFNVGVTNYDFNASTVIWQFFQQFQLNELILSNSKLDEVDHQNESYTVYPNPTFDQIVVKGDRPLNQVTVMDALGRLMYQSETQGLSLQLDLTSWDAGVYLIQINGLSRLFIKQ